MSKKIDEGGFAFPTQTLFTADGQFLGAGSDGMSLRDWFAGKALMGLLAHSFSDGSDFLHDAGPDAAAYEAYRMADAMIAARKAGAA